MKDKKKIIVPLLLAGVATSGVVANINNQVQTSAYAETAVETTNLTGADLTVGSFRKKDATSGALSNAESFKVGDKVYLPTCTTDSSAENLVYTVKKDKKTVKVEKDETLDAYYFTAKFQGYYTVSIAVKESGRVVTELTNLNVWVEKAEATIKLPTNSEYVIPAKMPKSQNNFKIPAPSVVTTNDVGEDVTTSARELGNDVAVYLVTPTKEVPLTLTQANAEDASKDYYAVASTDLAETGTYQIVYEYKQGSSVVARLESNFQVVDNYDTSKIKLKMKLLSSMPSSGNVNTDISIPKIKVSDANTGTDSINAYVKVIVKNVKTGEEVAVNYDDYSFRPTKEGYYSVTYVASIGLFGDNVKTGEVTPGDIIEVTDKQAPVVIPTYAYDMADGEITKVYNKEEGTVVSSRKDAEELLVNRRVDIPSVAVMKKEAGDTKAKAKVTIPAAYATDNFYTFKGADNDEVKIVRTYRSGSAVSTVKTEPNKPAEIEFTTAGNAEIRYSATDKAGNTLGEIVYDIVIYGEDEDLSKGETKVSLNVGSTVVSDKDKTLTFLKPTATDTYDKNVDVRTFYKEAGKEEVELTKTNKDGKYEIKIADITANEFEIYARAYVDNALVGTRGTGEKDQLATSNVVESKKVTVTILKASDDAKAPEFKVVGSDFNTKLFEKNRDVLADSSATKIDNAGYLTNGTGRIKIGETDVDKAAFDQGSTNQVVLPTVQFTENKDTNLNISVRITDRKGNLVSKSVQEKVERSVVGGEQVYTVSNVAFKLSQYGVYTVTYTAKDFAGNITVKSFGIRVNDKTAPTITVVDEDKFNKTIEVGEFFEVPSVILTKDGKEIDTNGSSWSWEIVGTSAGADCMKSSNGFTPTTEGTFFIKYTANDGLGNVSSLTDKMYSVTAKDTKAPKIELDLNTRFPATKEWAPAENEDFMNIDIPVAFATDENRGQVNVVYTVTGPNGTKPEVKDYEDRDDVKYFKATAQGTYTVKYSATDEAGNESTMTKTVSVGDCDAPTLTWENQEKDLVTEAKLNQVYKLDFNDLINNNKIKLTDNKTTSQATLLEKMTVTLTGPDGTTVKNIVTPGNGYEWTLNKTGQYKLKINVKDEVGNNETYTYTITVPNEEADSNKVSPVLGTVLVVLSVVVLAGVVVYFVASSKKKSSKKTTTKKSK